MGMQQTGPKGVQVHTPPIDEDDPLTIVKLSKV